jgi:hypothetical protein
VDGEPPPGVAGQPEDINPAGSVHRATHRVFARERSLEHAQAHSGKFTRRAVGGQPSAVSIPPGGDTSARSGVEVRGHLQVGRAPTRMSKAVRSERRWTQE